jgi:hypothetical protein
MLKKVTYLAAAVSTIAPLTVRAQQTAPNVSQVLMFSTVTSANVGSQFSQSSLFSPEVSGKIQPVLFGLYSERATGASQDINAPGTYQPASPVALTSAISSAVGVALSLIPVASPASAIIPKTDRATGLTVGSSATLGPILTERAETIGKGHWYVGFSHQNYHFTSINGESLNGLTILYKGGDSTTITSGSGRTTSQPATFNLGLDVRLSQDLAFITYGLTDRVDLSVGLPVVHSAVAATAFNAQVFTGDGLGGGGPQAGSNCWCMNTLSPGTFQTTQAFIGQSALGKTGFGDVLVRAKGAIIDRRQAVVSIGADLRLPTGDETNYLGTGTTSVKPFAAVSFLTRPTSSGVVLSPHFNIGWQFSGKSILAGTFTGTPETTTMNGPNGSQTVPYLAPPLVATKQYLPDVFQWAVGAELGFGPAKGRNTLVLDVIGNQIGWIHGAPNVQDSSAAGFSPITYAPVNATGVVAAPNSSYGQYSGAFGYKIKLMGNLVATFNALVRLNNSGLTARFVPFYGLSYSF